MMTVNDILTGFDAIRAEGAAYVVDLSAAEPFRLIDVARSVALKVAARGSMHSPGLVPDVSDNADVHGDSTFVLWQRHDGIYGAIAPLNRAGEATGSIGADGDGLILNVGGRGEGVRPAAVFAVAADPFVAADFCRAAAKRISSTVQRMASAPEGVTRPLSDGGCDASYAAYAGAVEAVWAGGVKFAAPTPGGAYPAFEAAVHAAFENSAAITRDRLFVDCRTEPRLLKVFAHKGRDGLLGIFHANWRSDEQGHDANRASPITDTWRVDDIEGLGGEHFAAWHAIERKLIIIDRGVDEVIELPGAGAELIHLVPILQNVAPLGLISRLNSSAAMARVGSRKCRLADGGSVGWYVAVKPTTVLLDGEPVTFEYQQASGLLTFDAAAGRPHDSEVVL